MTFQDSIATCLRKYATFEGRASRSEFWWFMLFFVLAIIIPSIISEIAANIIALALLVPNLAVSARRLHDIKKSGWFLLLGLIPIIGSIILLVWSIQKSDPNDNEYGPVPAEVAQAAIAAPPGAV